MRIRVEIAVPHRYHPIAPRYSAKIPKHRGVIARPPRGGRAPIRHEVAVWSSRYRLAERHIIKRVLTLLDSHTETPIFSSSFETPDPSVAIMVVFVPTLACWLLAGLVFIAAVLFKHRQRRQRKVFAAEAKDSPSCEANQMTAFHAAAEPCRRGEAAAAKGAENRAPS